MLRKTLYALITLVLLSSTSTVVMSQPFTLGIGDLVKISIYDHPDLSSVERISEDGTISFPLIGELEIAGLTERQAEIELATQLRRKQIVRSPQVNLIVEEYQSQRVSVLGHVAKPGIYSISRDSTVLDLIAEAGGLTEEAGSTAVVTQGPGAIQNRTTVDLDRLLKDGSISGDVTIGDRDRIFVPRMSRFYIYGQVNKPNAYRLEPQMTVMQALSVAGGLTNRGTERGITITRAAPDGEGTVAVKADRASELQDNDVVYVKQSLF